MIGNAELKLFKLVAEAVLAVQIGSSWDIQTAVVTTRPWSSSLKLSAVVAAQHAMLFGQGSQGLTDWQQSKPCVSLCPTHCTVPEGTI
jgi:hypothetical protein